MKKLLTVWLIVGLLTMSGCSLIWPDSSSSEESRTSSASEPALAEEYAGQWCYQRLDARLKANYAALYTAVRQGMEQDVYVTSANTDGSGERDYLGVQVELPFTLYTEAEARLLYTAFTRDNPHLFYIGSTYSYKGYHAGSADYYTTFTLVYTMNASERAAAASLLEEKVNALLTQAQQLPSQFEKQLYLHDQLLAACRYDHAAAESERPMLEYPQAFTAYGALVEGKAVCEGYSRALQLLLNRVGMECTLVSGTDLTSGIAHMWNMVTVDGRNYHVDATWNDRDDLPRHVFFNLTSSEIERTHSLDNENIGVDTCVSTQAGYYRYTKRFIDDYQKSRIVEAVAEEIRSGATWVELQFPSTKFPNAFLFVNKHELFREEMDRALQAAGMRMWDYTLESYMDYGVLILRKKAE